ncbi:MAG: nucleotidyltransferase domain-containing protein [Bacteroides sp.]|nr:nucleotidyltransferase domain-containing protein [Bacteroides sp.]
MPIEYGQMLDLIKRNVHDVDPSAQVLLYGSRARGEAQADSDWDILVLSSKEKLTFQEEEQFMDHICDLMVQTGQAIQLFAYGSKDWHSRHSMTPFYQSVKSEAIVL